MDDNVSSQTTEEINLINYGTVYLEGEKSILTKLRTFLENQPADDDFDIEPDTKPETASKIPGKI